MKKRFQKIAYIAIFISFVWGLWWGLYQDYKKNPDRWSQKQIFILANQDFLDDELIKKFSQDENIDLNIKTIKKPQDFFREMLTNGSHYDLVQVNTFLIDSFLIENVFAEVDWSSLENYQSISVDFQNFNFDLSGQYFVPLFWGINGFVHKKSEPLESDVQELKKDQLSLLDSPVEIYNFVSKVKPIIKNWVATGDEESLIKDIKLIQNQLPGLHAESDFESQLQKHSFVQAANGLAARFLAQNQDYQFSLPPFKANLWVGLIGLTKDSKNKKVARVVVDKLLSQKWSEKMVVSSRLATVNSQLDLSSTVLTEQKSNYIRQLRLSRFDFFYDKEVFEPLWARALKEVYSEHFK